VLLRSTTNPALVFASMKIELLVSEQRCLDAMEWKGDIVNKVANLSLSKNLVLDLPST
jgi:hypothetical protein